MRPQNAPFPGRATLAWLCLTYIIVVLYASTVIGPIGCNFVKLDPIEAFHRFLDTQYVPHGSDQRADWIGNLLMLVPFGFLITGTIWPRRPVLKPAAVMAAMLIAVIAILAIKYLQLFFPPRTVTLNYIVAQSVGAAVGCGCFILWHERLGLRFSRQDPVAALVTALWLYCAALVIFLLMPLDFALSAADLSGQVERLPSTILALPGAGRPLGVRLMVVGAATASFVPVGMMLALVRGRRDRARPRLAVTTQGLAVTTGIFALSALVMGAAPTMVSILFRTFGITMGAAMLRWLSRQNLTRLRARLGRSVPWLVLPYLGGVLMVNRLLSLHFLSLPEAIGQGYPLGLLPLFDYYIVSKADAAKNIVAHVLMYMPIGLGVWLCGLRANDGPASRARCFLAFAVGATLSFCVELGRYFRPGLQGDINAVVLGGLSAMLTAGLMPAMWRMLAAIAAQAPPVPERRPDLARPAFAPDDALVLADEIEEY